MEYTADQPPLSAWATAYGVDIPAFTEGMRVALVGPLLHTKSFTENVTAADLEEEGITSEELEEFRHNTAKEGPQALAYFLDSFVEESQNLPTTAANYLFISYMAVGMAEGKFPVDKGYPGTPGFRSHLRKGFDLVKRYVCALNEDQFEQLTPELKRFRNMGYDDVGKYTEQFLLIRVGVCKGAGMLDDWTMEKRKKAPFPQQAFKQGKSYLNCDFRNLPQNSGQIEKAPPPSQPWREYTTNTQDNTYQLFGRYEALSLDGVLQVDYRLDSTLFPAKYGFFSAIEITDRRDGEIIQRVVLGQEVDKEIEERQLNAALLSLKALGNVSKVQGLVFPIIVAGEFDFSDLRIRPYLMILAGDKNVKPDIGNVLSDILKMYDKGELKKLEDFVSEEKKKRKKPRVNPN